MRVVVIATAEPYHRFLCAEIARRHPLIAVLHPMRPNRRLHDRLQLLRRRVAQYGLTHVVLRKALSRNMIPGAWNEQRDLAEACRVLCSTAESDYRQYVSGLAHHVADINSPEGVALLESLKPDVVLCSGGPVYRPAVISACGLMLNYHTGLSPIYNGATTGYWTFANRQPHITGGTMMTMSPRVDAGDILAHYLPKVEAGDTPGRQFVKTIIGGVRLYCEFLADLKQGKRFVGVPQGRPFRYYYREDWTVFQSLTIKRYIINDICKEFEREERVHKYWRMSEQRAGEAALAETLLEAVYSR